MALSSTQRSHLVLAGAGHAHVEVLRRLSMQRPEDVEVTVISPDSYAIYSGMVPGYLAGHYDMADIRIDARALAARAGARFLATRVESIDPGAKRLRLLDHPDVSYDFVSFDIGSIPAAQQRILDREKVIAVKPIEIAATQLGTILADGDDHTLDRVVIVGAGPGGVEVAFALAARLDRGRHCKIAICDRASTPVAERGARCAAVVAQALREHSIDFLAECDVTRVDGEGVGTADGRTLAADLVVWATGAAAPPLFADAGLRTDERGFLLAGDDLRSLDDPTIFAAGDCATLHSHPDLAKAGVYAVRQGPVLAANLRAATRGDRLKTFRPQPHFLSLLNTADGKAVFSYRGRAWRGRAAWRLKDRIDRRFIERYRLASLAPDSSMGEMQPCGGCAAKVGADVLSRVLGELDVATDPNVLIGLERADDAAVFAAPRASGDSLSVVTADLFPPFSADLQLVGHVAAVNAASDLFAMGAEGAAAVAMVSLGSEEPARQEESLRALLAGATRALVAMKIPLVGGHTIAHGETLIGFSMHGFAARDRLLTKTGAQVGDTLVLTKPLGTGVILAAARAGYADSHWLETAQREMMRSNAPAMRVLLAHAARACTDVTGFGLLGHLADLANEQCSIELDAAQVPALPGAIELLAAGWRSSFHATNARASGLAQGEDDAEDRHPLLIDPQTSGGLLAAIPAEHITSLQTAAGAAGVALHTIGRFIAARAQPVAIV